MKLKFNKTERKLMKCLDILQIMRNAKLLSKPKSSVWQNLRSESNSSNTKINGIGNL